MWALQTSRVASSMGNNNIKAALSPRSEHSFSLHRYTRH